MSDELAVLIAEQERDDRWGHRADLRGPSLDFGFEGGDPTAAAGDSRNARGLGASRPATGGAMKHESDMAPYRVGLGRDLHALRYCRRWWQIRATLRRMLRSMTRRSWWGLWQVEWPGCQRAVRGLTADHAYRRAVRRRARPQENGYAGEPPSAVETSGRSSASSGGLDYPAAPEAASSRQTHDYGACPVPDDTVPHARARLQEEER